MRKTLLALALVAASGWPALAQEGETASRPEQLYDCVVISSSMFRIEGVSVPVTSRQILRDVPASKKDELANTVPSWLRFRSSNCRPK